MNATRELGTDHHYATACRYQQGHGVVTELKQFGTLAASGRGASRAWHQHVDQNVVALALVNDRTDHGGVSSRTPVPPRLARASLAGEHGERMALLECQRRSATSRRRAAGALERRP